MSLAAVQKPVAVAGTGRARDQTSRGREQVVHVDVATFRRATEPLDAYGRLWRHRVEGIEQILAEDQEGK
jgi:hypothetical protein